MGANLSIIASPLAKYGYAIFWNPRGQSLALLMVHPQRAAHFMRTQEANKPRWRLLTGAGPGW